VYYFTQVFEAKYPDFYSAATSIKVVPEQSGKVEYEHERLLGIANKFIHLNSCI
jgi:hypothetical protein